MFRLTIAALALSAVMAPAALAQPVNTITASDGPPTATRVTAKDGIVCKTLVVTGSRIPLETKCMTQEDWDSIKGRGKADYDALMNANRTRNCVAGPGGMICQQGGG